MGSQNEIGHPARRHRQLMQVPELSAHGIELGSKTCVTVFLGWHFEIVDMTFTFREILV